MNDRDRLEQLREMLGRLERMPASGDRDWMLNEVRARTVDVETGALPAAMRPRHQEEETAEPPPRVERRSAPRPRPRPVPRPTWQASAAPAPERPQPVRHEGRVDLLQGDGLLCLDEPAIAADRPWTRGLRG
jgi:hypothetical protein